MILIGIIERQALFGLTLRKKFYIPTQVDGWESIEERLCIFAISLFGYEFFIDKFISNERVVEQDYDEEAE